ncbi:hypothetical protein Tco_1393833 [Tanacetum coccineum]
MVLARSKSNQKSPASAADDAHSCKNFKTDGGLQTHNHDKRRGNGQSLDVKFQRPGVQVVISLMAMCDAWKTSSDNVEYIFHMRKYQGQQGPVGGPAQPELPEEAGSSS